MKRVRRRGDVLLGAVFAVLGILLLVGVLTFPFGPLVAGIVILVLGALMLLRIIRAPVLLGVLLAVVGALMLASGPVGDEISGVVMQFFEIGAAITLLVVGLLKIGGRW